jgi:F-type H+-transporting ATPase subunit a
VRPVSLSLRLFGNINADHLTVSSISDMMPLGAPIIFMAFGIFVCFIQAFVFTLLSSVYVALAADTDH